MALTVPTKTELATHMQKPEPFEEEEESWADESLQHATDLMTIATGLDADSDDGLTARVVKRGILAMAHALFVRGGDRDAMYSPYSSERIGSYSYSKMQQDATKGLDTGVPDFDLAVSFVNDAGLWETYDWTTAEDVFATPMTRASTTDPDRKVFDEDEWGQSPEDSTGMLG